MEMSPEYKVTIIKNLVAGINTARKRNEELQLQLYDAKKFEDIVNIKQEIETMDEWMVELANALHWLNGTQYEEMKEIYPNSIIERREINRRKGERRHV